MNINWDDIEPGIKPHVEKFIEGGWKTWASCEHDMYVSLNLDDWSQIPALSDWLKREYPDEHNLQIDTCSPNRMSVTVYLEIEDAPAGREDFVLLKFPPRDVPVYVVLRKRHWPHNDCPENDAQQTYFYNEGTCPTNWVSDIDEFILEMDADPHGVAEYVATKAVPDDWGDNDGWELLELFKEELK